MTNIALVVLDTLRKDAFDKHFDWLPGKRFERAYSTANWTVPAHASLFTGFYSSEVGVHATNMFFDADKPAIAEQLQEVGYTTRAFSANTHVSGHFDFDRGFTQFKTPAKIEQLNDDDQFDWLGYNRNADSTGVEKYLKALYACLRDDSATIPSLLSGINLLRYGGNPTEYGGSDEALDWLRDTQFGKQEFLFLNLMEAHEPYRAPPEFQTVKEPELTDSVGNISIGEVNAQQTKQAYDDCARYLSDNYKKIFNHLNSEFDYVITLADHGELLGEHDSWGHEYGVYPELTHVPLVISGEGLSGSESRAASILDAHRTIQTLADIEGESRGRDLRDGMFSKSFLTEYHGLTSWSEKKLNENGYQEAVERYNKNLRGYAHSQDYYGYETQSRIQITGAERAPNISEKIQQICDELNIRTVEENNDVPDEVKDRLEDLGYA
ncbi:sulfatase-like hydrolase/transferase [Haladaptatus sp. NG-WS-4]